MKNPNLKLITSKPPLKTARKNALNMLSRRDHSVWEIQKKLRLKHHSEEIVSQVVSKLLEDNLLDDQKFALSWGRFRSELCHYGPIKLQREFQEKGLSSELISKALQEIEAQFPPAQIAERALLKRYPQSSDLKESVTRKKAFDFLSRKGHQSNTILHVFRKLDRNKESTPVLIPL